MLRIFAIVLIVVSSASAVIAGVTLVQFELAAAPLRTDTSKAPVEAFGFWRRPPDVKPIMSPWTGTLGVGGDARKLIFESPDRAQDIPRLLLDVTRALEAQPTSAQAWIAYFELGSRSGYANERTFPALTIATITGRREASILLLSAELTMRHWVEAPEHLRRQAIATIVEFKFRLREPEYLFIANAINSNGPAVLNEIKSELLPKFEGNPWLKKMFKL